MSRQSDVRQSRLMTFLCDRGRYGVHSYASNGRFDLRVYWPSKNDEPMFEVRASRGSPGGVGAMMRPGDMRWLRREIDLLLDDVGDDAP